LTKLHEEIVSGTLSTLCADFAAREARGEMVIVIGRGTSETAARPATLTIDVRVAELVSQGKDEKASLKLAAKEFGLSKSEAYRLLKVKK